MYDRNLKSRPIVGLIFFAFVIGMIIVLVASCCCREPKQVSGKGGVVRALVVTGGHDYEKEPFFEMFDAFENISYVHYELRDDSEMFEDISGWDYDVIVLYNMTQRISQRRKENFKELLGNKGVGLVAVHHSIANFQDWDEYHKMIGCIYFLEDKVIDGVSYKRSDYQHDVRFNIFVEDKRHPVTRGLDDFEILDETYKNYLVDKENKILLRTDAAGSEEQICWVREYGKSRVCYIQLGHGRSSFEDANYRRLLSQAIIWSSGRVQK